MLDAIEGQGRAEILEGFDNLEVTVTLSEAVHWRDENRSLSAVDLGGKGNMQLTFFFFIFLHKNNDILFGNRFFSLLIHQCWGLNPEPVPW